MVQKPYFCPPLREVVTDRRVKNLNFLFSTPSIPLVGGQNGANTHKKKEHPSALLLIKYFL